MELNNSSSDVNDVLTTDEIVERMSAQGLRITDQRKTLAKLFADTPGYLAQGGL